MESIQVLSLQLSSISDWTEWDKCFGLRCDPVNVLVEFTKHEASLLKVFVGSSTVSYRLHSQVLRRLIGKTQLRPFSFYLNFYTYGLQVQNLIVFLGFSFFMLVRSFSISRREYGPRIIKCRSIVQMLVNFIENLLGR